MEAVMHYWEIIVFVLGLVIAREGFLISTLWKIDVRLKGVETALELEARGHWRNRIQRQASTGRVLKMGNAVGPDHGEL
jgi:hypothetical protein